MTIYSKRLAGGYLVGPSTTVIYTAPSAGVIVVRDIVLAQNDGSNRHVIIYTATPGGAVAELVGATLNGVSDSQHWPMRQVLEPGEVLSLVTISTGQTFYRISGYQLA